MSNSISPYGFLRSGDGLSLRYGHWPCPDHPPKGTVLILQGRSEYMEKYGETIAALHDRGMDVFSFDWRGQGLSDRLLADREKGFVGHYDDYLDDLGLILETIVRPDMRGALYLLAHSMGGHIGLRYLYRNGPVFAKAVFCAPMIDIVTSPFPPFFARWLSRGQVLVGNAERTAVGAARRTPFPDRFRNNLWTSDRARFDRNRKLVKMTPALSAALVTYGWIAATYDSIDILKPAAGKQTLKTPLLFLIAGSDRVVSNRDARAFAVAADNCRLVEIIGARHEILQEADPYRGTFWRSVDEFMGL